MLLKGADYLEIVLMAVGLGTLKYTLEEGTRWNWFDDATIRQTAMVAGILLPNSRTKSPPIPGAFSNCAARRCRSCSSTAGTPVSARLLRRVPTLAQFRHGALHALEAGHWPQINTAEETARIMLGS